MFILKLIDIGNRQTAAKGLAQLLLKLGRCCIFGCMKLYSDHVLAFYQGLKSGWAMPEGIELLNPFIDPQAWQATKQYYQKYYADTNPRVLVFGINPGRFGAGVTGIPFTDPINLEKYCHITNPFEARAELSSQFVYQFIEAYGGVEPFCQQFFITAVCPLGFTRQGKNLNYYDDKALINLLEPLMVDYIKQQIDFGTTTACCICLGEGKNYNYLKKLNEAHGLFDTIYPLAHPRYIMQYKRKLTDQYIAQYVDTLSKCAQALP